MAAAGDSLGTILTCGDWRSKAILNYVEESAVDASRLLLETLDASDEENGEDLDETVSDNSLPVL